MPKQQSKSYAAWAGVGIAVLGAANQASKSSWGQTQPGQVPGGQGGAGGGMDINQIVQQHPSELPKLQLDTRPIDQRNLFA